MLFSILIANYNNSKFIRDALDSIIAQTYTNWEIIIVDDGSTDEFEKSTRKYRTDSRIKIFYNEKNMGCGYTKRKCVEKSSGVLFAFLDPDDALTPDALQTMYDAHVENPDHSLIHGFHYICDEKLNITKLPNYVKALPPDIPYLLLSDGSVHQFASFKKSFYLKTEGISSDNKKAVDQDLYYKMEETGKIYFIDKPLYYYRIHGGGISTSGNEWAATIWHYKVIEEACQRRIKRLKKSNNMYSKYWIKKYQTRFYKIRIFSSFRKKQWLSFLYNLGLFPFMGGMENLISYARKLPTEGFSLIRRSFIEDHKIEA